MSTKLEALETEENGTTFHQTKSSQQQEAAHHVGDRINAG
jgi:hypothetical protein